MKKSAKTYVNLDNARTQEQTSVMQDIVSADHCPFCRENLEKYHKLPILKEGDFWLVTENQWPYQHTKHHFLIIYKNHITRPSELEKGAGDELIELSAWIEKEYQFPGGGLVMRFGDTDYSAGSVSHLHAQVLMPDIHHPTYDQKPVRVKIGRTRG